MAEAITVNSRVALAEAIAKSWNREKICYAVAHGLERYPYSVGRDLDIVIRDDQIEDAIFLASFTFTRKGWVAIRPPNLWGERLVGFKKVKGEIVSLEIHTMRVLSWGPVLLAHEPNAELHQGPFKVDPWISFVRRIFLPLLAGDVRRFQNKPQALSLDAIERLLVENMLPKYLGETKAQRLLEMLDERSLDDIARFLPSLRQTLVLRSLVLRPFEAVRSSLMWANKRLLQFVMPCAPIVAIVGPDGVGKSTVITQLSKQVRSVFTKVLIKHWRPGLLPGLGTLIGRKASVNEVTVKPRQEPGRFHWLRLAYYFVDFTLGYLLKDVVLSSREQLVLYDRCALDMVVHPVRYGLRSSHGTRLLWKLIPKPDLLILLYDRPESILVRKHELNKTEVEWQLKEWLRLAAEHEVHAIIRVDDCPEEISRRVADLVVATFVRKNGGNLVYQTTLSNVLEWLGSVLSKNYSDVRIHEVGGVHDRIYRKQSEQHNDTKRLSELHGFSVFALFPNHLHPRLLVPLVSPKVGVASLQVYNPVKLYARLGKALLSVGLRAGLVQRFLCNRFSVDVRFDVPENRLKDLVLEEHLKDIFERKNLTIAVSLGTPGPHQKPVIQVMSLTGEVLGYVKVGWNGETTRLVQNEEAILRRLEHVSFSTAMVPRVLYAGAWNNTYLLIQSPPPARGKNPSKRVTPAHLAFLREHHFLETTNCKVCESGFWRNLRSRIELLRNMAYYLHVLEQGITVAEDWIGKANIPFGLRHGDFVPWNTRLVQKKLFVFDWEYAKKKSPPAWDLFHFLIQTAVLVHGYHGGQIYKDIIGNGQEPKLLEEYFARISLQPDLIEPLLLVYLLDVLSWSLAQDGDITDQKGQRLRQTWIGLVNILVLRKGIGS